MFYSDGGGQRISPDGAVEATGHALQSSENQARVMVDAASGSLDLVLDYQWAEHGCFRCDVIGGGWRVFADVGSFTTDGEHVVLVSGTESLVPLPKLGCFRTPAGLDLYLGGLINYKDYVVEKSTDLKWWNEVGRVRATGEEPDTHWSDEAAGDAGFYRAYPAR